MIRTNPSSTVVLVVEDDVLLRMETVETLEDEGFEVIEAGTADEAIGILEARRDIAIIVSDIQMPGALDGIQLARAVRDRWPPIDLILTSGRPDVRPQDIPERALFFAKPVSPDEIVRAIKQFTANPIMAARHDAAGDSPA